MKFVLFDQIPLEKLLSTEKYEEFEKEEVEAMVEEAAKVAKDLLFPICTEGDAQGCSFNPEDHSVKTPDGYKDAFERYRANGWLGMSYNPEYGGMGLPHVVGMACGDFFVGANTSFDLCTMLTTECAHLIESFGTDELKNVYLEKMYTGEWTGTMCLTEPQAGTDVGATKAKATPNEDGSYNIEGQKIFITFGEHDLTKQIVHAVLARVEGDPPGTKGLSLFVVPKYRPTEDGEIGEFNDLRCTGIEHKMGIHASPTVTLSFGDDGKCKGWLLGQQSKGMRQMFQMMNAARLGVGLQGAASANAAYQCALQYAKERTQGPSFKRLKDPEAPKAPIVDHPDVRRMLMLQKAYAEGLRSLLLTVGYYQDMAESADSEELREKYNGLVEIMIPICKAYGSDMGFRVCEWAVQTLGGYGYCAEYPAEQLLRDVKIASIYEGTNGIQAMDLVGRKITAKMGANLMSVMEMINKQLDENKDHPALKKGYERLAGARDALNECNMHFFTAGQSGDFLTVLLNATPYLELFGDVLLGYHLLEQGVIAHKKLGALLEEKGIDPSKKRKMKRLLAEDRRARFLDGKIKTALFFANTILPLAPGKAAAIRSGDQSAMEVVFDPLE
jgi:hypothetical protein